MHIISFKKLKDFFETDSQSRVALQDWYKRARKAEWENFADLKDTFNSADNIGNSRFVFIVKGNHYRVIAVVRFTYQRIFIRWVGNHKEYGRLKNIDKI